MIIRILKAMVKAAEKEYAEIKKEEKTQIYNKLWVDKWNNDLDWINYQIQVSQTEQDTNWYWGQLVKQEFKMWSLIAKPIDLKEINSLCDVRGFNDRQRKYIIDMTRHMGILISDEEMKAIKEKERLAEEKRYGSYEKKMEEKAA